MAYYPFNSATLSFAGTTYKITSFSMEGGTRAEIDVTATGDTRRSSIAGMATPRMLNFGINYEGSVAALTNLLETCAPGALVVQLGADCDAATDHITVNAYLMSFDITGELDGIVTGNLSFMVQE